MRNSVKRPQQKALLAGSATLALAIAAMAAPAQAIVPNENKTPADIIDNDDVFRGVGAVVTNVVGAGGVGICTGTLINPRTVLFAAHCVNTRPEEAYDGTTVRAAVSFNVNALPGIQSWFANTRTNTDLSVFNVNRIFWDRRSVQNPQAFGFIEADIALASLDTPAAGIPTWAMLFSTLPAPETIDPALGTGYHVNITGYGRSGNAIQGAINPVDWRRRAAENMLGGFMSLDDRNNVLFGPGAPNLPQNLYHIDFDSQQRQAPFDINVHRDDALPNEGITSPGNSGGPLILGAANNAITNEDLIIGVLSGGSRFFGPQPFSSLGTTSFYQPLSLFWEYIVANNPYRYVTARAGNGNWEDGAHWEVTLDPHFRVINADGAIVNGLPTTPELGLNGTGGAWGAVCVEFGGPGDFCDDLGASDPGGEKIELTNGALEVDFTPYVPGYAANEAEAVPASYVTMANDAAAPVAGEPASQAARAGNGVIAEDVAINGSGLIVEDMAINGIIVDDIAISGGAIINDNVAIGGGVETVAMPLESAPEPGESPAETPEPPRLPDPTLANGLPGATGFVPNNVDPVVSADPALRVDPRYFDVTLAAAGTTTLSSDVTIDRLTVRGPAGLNIAAAGNLTSLIDVSQFGGLVNVNGALNSVGDYTIFAGMLSGNGTITAPFVTSIMGTIAPGTMGTIGTLTIDGSLVMSSGSVYLVDIGASGASDRIVVTGEASIGGLVGVGPGLGQQVSGLGQQFTILTAEGGVTGEFTAGTISPILSQAFIYDENSVRMQINAASYTTVINTGNPVQASYAQLFDQNRPNNALAGLYQLDFEDAATIRSTFEGLAPVTETTIRSLAAQSIHAVQNFNAGRLREADRSKTGGKLAVSGSPLQVAQASLNPMIQPVGAAAMAFQSEGESDISETSLPDNVGVFVSAGAIGGSARGMPGYPQQTTMSGFFVGGGVEFYPADSSVIGASVFYSEIDANPPLGQVASSDTLAGSVFARHKFDAGFVLDGQVSLGSFGLDTTRTVTFPGGPQNLRSDSSDTLFSAGLGVSYDIETSFGTISPGIEGRHARVDLDTVSEDGGLLALTLERQSFKTTQARGGFAYRKQGQTVQINLYGQAVFELENGPQFIGANFANGIGPSANFALDTQDEFWVEVGASMNYGDGPFQIGVGFDSTIGRSNANAQIWRVQGIYRF
ncbi:MAG: autotransporter domain-containing protein [Erythrobacter sp.]